MGNEQQKERKSSNVEIDKNKLDIIIKQIYFTAQLNKDRRRGLQLNKEKELFTLIREPTNKRNKENEYQKAASIANDVKWIKAHEYLMRYADIIKDNEMVIQQSKGDATKINDLLPYVESILWGCQKCNLTCVDPFNSFIIDSFGPDVHNALCVGSKVTSELKDCFNTVIASEREVKLYFVEFCKQQGLDIALINEAGHDISPEKLIELDSKDNSPKKGDDHNGHNPTQGPDMPGPNFPGSHPQNGYLQGGFTQGRCTQNGFSEDKFPQGVYPQSSYPYNGSPQNTFPYNPYSQDRMRNFPSNQQIIPPNVGLNLQPGVQHPEAPKGTPLLAQSDQSHQNFQDPVAYPTFQRLNLPNNGGNKANVDPLDDLDLRLRNIKNGL